MNGFWFKVNSVHKYFVELLDPMLVVVSGWPDDLYNGNYVAWRNQKRFVQYSDLIRIN